MFANVRQRSKNGEYVGRTIGSMMLTATQESSQTDDRPASSNSDQMEATESLRIQDDGPSSFICTLITVF